MQAWGTTLMYILPYRVILSPSAVRDKEHHVQTNMTNNHINDKANTYYQMNINRDNSRSLNSWTKQLGIRQEKMH